MITREMESTPVPGRSTRVDKIQKNKWNTETGSFGTDAMIDKWDLNVDTSYQRNISETRIKAISSGWRWEGVGKLVVAEREDGKLFVVDGQHRLIAARKRSDVNMLPCLVYRSNSIAEEAELFLLLNTGRGPMGALQRFKSLVITKNPIALSIKSVAEDLGLVIPEKYYNSTTKSNKVTTLACVAALLDTWKQNPVLAEKSLRLSKAIAQDKAITKELYHGLFLLTQKLDSMGDSINNYSKKLIDAGYVAVVNSIKSQTIALGYGGQNVWASGILAVINKNKRNRVIVNGVA